VGTAKPNRAPQPLGVRCASCRRTIGWTDGLVALRNKVYCSSWCMDEPVATPTESRTDEWRVLNKVGHLSPVAISKVYGVAHSQVYGALGR
jgi:hypothetical protein